MFLLTAKLETAAVMNPKYISSRSPSVRISGGAVSKSKKIVETRFL